jgi:GDP-4-dehydro-6-deoxy-D-mannose reductase
VRRVLVTGPNGFVGGHLRGELGDAFVPFEEDVLDADALRASIRETRPDGVVHLAAQSSVGDSWSGVAEVWRVNVLGTVSVLEALRAEAPGVRLVFASSGDVYGRASVIPTPEDAPAEPVSPYAASKAAAEIACRQSELDVVIARAFPHVGPGQDERFAIGSWTAQLARLRAKGGGVLRVGDLGVERDLNDVRDVCRAYRLMLDRGAPAGTYNVCSGRAVSLKRVVELLVGLAGVEVEVQRDDARLRRAEVPVLRGDPTKLKETTGWQPEMPLEQTLADALEAAARAEVVRS